MIASKSNRSLLDLELILRLTIFYSVFEIIHVLKISFFLGQNKLFWPKYFWEFIFIDWILVISFMSLIAVSIKKLILKNIAWSKIFAVHFLFSILISFLIQFAVAFYYIWAENLSIQSFNKDKFREGLMANVDTNFVIYFSMLLIIYSYYYQREIRMNEVQRQTLKSQLLTTRIKMLTTQLQPHFLFNTLNGISSLIGIDKKQAQDMIADLGDFLREMLYHSDSTFTTVGKELKLLDKYLNLLKTRFWEQLITEKRIDVTVIDEEIPAMLLQPLIENATKHGFSPDNPELKIIISIYSRNNYLYLEVENNGKSLGKTGSKSTGGVGLQNLEERLKNLYGTSYRFSIRNKENSKGVICCIAFPIKRK